MISSTSNDGGMANTIWWVTKRHLSAAAECRRNLSVFQVSKFLLNYCHFVSLNNIASTTYPFSALCIQMHNAHFIGNSF